MSAQVARQPLFLRSALRPRQKAHGPAVGARDGLGWVIAPGLARSIDDGT